MKARWVAGSLALTALACLAVAPLVAFAGSPRAPAPGAPVTEQATGTRTSPAPRSVEAQLTPNTMRRIQRGLSVSTVHTASSTTVTISDFKFSPSSVTIHVGDTVTWSNNGPSGHSATSDTNTFNTGILNKGSVGSFTFKNAGTFSYHCTPHPFMKASVIVTSGSSGGSNGSSGGSSGSSSSSGSSTPSSGSSSSGTGSSSNPLPHTGLEIGSLLLTGIALLGLGLVLRRGVRYPADGSG